MRGFLMFLCFLFFLPLAGAIAHDIWHAMNDKGGLDFSKPFPFSDLGWLWKTYEPDSMKFVQDMVDKDTWKQFIGPVLEQKSVVVAAVPFLIVAGLTALLKMFGIPPFEGESIFARKIGFGKKDKLNPYSFTGEKKKKAVKYNRK